jgi:hypothetical protein
VDMVTFGRALTSVLSRKRAREFTEKNPNSKIQMRLRQFKARWLDLRIMRLLVTHLGAVAGLDLLPCGSHSVLRNQLVRRQ